MRVLSMMGRGGVGTRLITSNSAAGLSAALLTVEEKKMSACTIQCDGIQANAARVSWGKTAPSYGASAVGYYLAKGESVRIIGEYNCATFKYISAVASTAAVLQIIPEY